MPEERKFKRPLKFFTSHPDKSLRDILSWGYLEDLKVYAIKREYGLVKTKKIKQYLYGPEVKFHEQRLWGYIQKQDELNFPDWKPQQPKCIVKFDLVTREKDITLHVKHPRCLRNMPLK
ncbi:hypothetical protein Hanom_Chr17g01573221 [Helianthus anomalus]